jgi:3-oxoacyl-[acyl-carrier protein] reductase
MAHILKPQTLASSSNTFESVTKS